MRLKFSGVVAGALGLAVALAGCGSTNNVSSTTTATSGATNVSFGSANQKLCSSSVNTTPNYKNTIGTVSGGASTISGGGSTFAAPMYSEWGSLYDKASGVAVAYASIGSGGGVSAIQAETLNFGDSDSGMTPAEISAAKGGPILQVPLLLGAVVPTYNLPGIPGGLKFTGSVLGDIFAGKITNWDDPALKALNPGVRWLRPPPVAGILAGLAGQR